MEISPRASFCRERNCKFPPVDLSLVAEYLASLAENSERPRSVLNNAMSALGHVFRALGLPNVTENYEIRMLTVALVKSGQLCLW